MACAAPVVGPLLQRRLQRRQAVLDTTAKLFVPKPRSPVTDLKSIRNIENLMESLDTCVGSFGKWRRQAADQ